MKIKEVFYQTSVEVAPYRHKHLGALVSVEPGEMPEEALTRAALWVHQQLGIVSMMNPNAYRPAKPSKRRGAIPRPGTAV